MGENVLMQPTSPITIAAVVRAIALVITGINHLLALKGMALIPFDSEAIEQFVSLALLGAAAAWGFWKDNDFTKWARRHKKPKKRGK